VGAHWLISNRPTSVEPVNDKCRTTGESHKALPMAIELLASAVNILITPSGMPARDASSAKAKADKGVCSAGLIMIEQPAARAGDTFRVIIALGKFHGVIAAQTPIGCLSTIRRLSSQVEVGIAPFTRFASSANHSIKDDP